MQEPLSRGGAILAFFLLLARKVPVGTLAFGADARRPSAVPTRNPFVSATLAPIPFNPQNNTRHQYILRAHAAVCLKEEYTLKIYLSSIILVKVIFYSNILNRY
jgi:hypothetical protein